EGKTPKKRYPAAIVIPQPDELALHGIVGEIKKLSIMITGSSQSNTQRINAESPSRQIEKLYGIWPPQKLAGERISRSCKANAMRVLTSFTKRGLILGIPWRSGAPCRLYCSIFLKYGGI
ncbi:MAG: hypothetical protein Q8R70_03675, partial [Methanoregula sp.]|nr:hypothetical protein [Methanoregula sp.]